jgi:hypothetical protein
MRKILTIAIVLTAFIVQAQSSTKKLEKETPKFLDSATAKLGFRIFSDSGYKMAAHYDSGKDILYVDDTTQVKSISVSGHVYKLSELGKKDSVAMPIYIFDKTDTSKTPETIIIEGKKGRLYKIQGYRIYTQKLATTDGKSFQPVSERVIIGALDEKKRPVKTITQ